MGLDNTANSSLAYFCLRRIVSRGNRFFDLSNLGHQRAFNTELGMLRFIHFNLHMDRDGQCREISASAAACTR